MEKTYFSFNFFFGRCHRLRVILRTHAHLKAFFFESVRATVEMYVEQKNGQNDEKITTENFI